MKPLDCNELVELVTDYLDETLDLDIRARFDAHLLDCDGCDNYLQQFRITIGAVGFTVRRNAIVAFMCVELMLNASNLAMVTFSRMWGVLDGQVASFFVMVVAAAEVVIGLAIIISIYRTRRSASVDDANLLKY